MDVSGMYWETYDDQNGADFKYVGYIDLSGKQVVTEIVENLAAMVNEIKRLNGQRTEVRVYR